jgi:hypothetical protein
MVVCLGQYSHFSILESGSSRFVNVTFEGGTRWLFTGLMQLQGDCNICKAHCPNTRKCKQDGIRPSTEYLSHSGRLQWFIAASLLVKRTFQGIGAVLECLQSALPRK